VQVLARLPARIRALVLDLRHAPIRVLVPVRLLVRAQVPVQVRLPVRIQVPVLVRLPVRIRALVLDRLLDRIQVLVLVLRLVELRQRDRLRGTLVRGPIPEVARRILVGAHRQETIATRRRSLKAEITQPIERLAGRFAFVPAVLLAFSHDESASAANAKYAMGGSR
jgi:hypothetical protein